MTASVLCLVAHPDDETRLTGGVLAKLAQRDVRVHLVCLTRGEGGELGEPPQTTRETLGQVREQELRCAAEQLGLASVTLLGYVDPTVGPGEELFAPKHDPAQLTAQVVAAISALRAQILLTHGSNGEYGHPAHRLLHAVARKAVAALPSGPAPLLYSFAARYPEHPYPRLTNEDDAAHLVVDVSAGFDCIVAAAECHRTQHALFGRRLSEKWGRPVGIDELIRLIPREGLRRHWPPTTDPSGDLMHTLLAEG